jgi:hypothetical protein
MGRGALAAADGAEPRVIEVPHVLAEEIFVEAQQLGTVDHALDRGIVAGEIAAVGKFLLGIRDGVDRGKSGIKRTLGSESVRDCGAGRKNERGIKKSGDVEIAVLRQAAREFGGIADAIRRTANEPERLGRGVEFMAGGGKRERDRLGGMRREDSGNASREASRIFTADP